jgi:hypothetical protein
MVGSPGAIYVKAFLTAFVTAEAEEGTSHVRGGLIGGVAKPVGRRRLCPPIQARTVRRGRILAMRVLAWESVTLVHGTCLLVEWNASFTLIASVKQAAPTSLAMGRV